MSAFALWRVLCLRLAAEVVLDGRRAGLDGPPGWADPVGWLRECLAAFDAGGHQHAASACRVLLRRGGVAVPRHGRNAAAPPELARLGITAREGDVLFLVADGLSNREIGERLFLSPRTIEKHVERLLGKTGVRDRSQLVSWAARRTASQGQARLRT